MKLSAKLDRLELGASDAPSPDPNPKENIAEDSRGLGPVRTWLIGTGAGDKCACGAGPAPLIRRSRLENLSTVP